MCFKWLYLFYRFLPCASLKPCSINKLDAASGQINVSVEKYIKALACPSHLLLNMSEEP